MLQVIVTIIVVVLIFGGFLLISLNRKEGRELKKSCGCNSFESKNGRDSNCINPCEGQIHKEII